MGRSVFSVLCLALLAGQALAAISVPADVFSDADAARVKELVGGRVKSLTGADLHYAAATLAALGGAIPEQSAVCSKLTSLLKTSDNLVELYHAVGAATSAKCSGVSLGEKAKKAVQAGLDSDELVDIFQAGSAAFALIESKAATAGDFELTSVPAKLIELLEEDGTVRASTSSDLANHVNAGRALILLGKLYGALHTHDSSLKEHIRTASEKLSDLLAPAGEEVNFAENSAETRVAAASLVLQGVNAIANSVSEDLDVPEGSFSNIAAFLVANKYSGSVSDLYYLVSAFNILANNQIEVPLAVTVQGSTVRVTNVLDKAAGKVKVTLKKATLAGSSAAVVENAEVPAGSAAGAFSLPTARLSSPGLYELTIAAESTESGSKARGGKAVRTLKVTGEIKAEKFEAYVSESSKAAAAVPEDAVRATSPNAWSGNLAAGAGKYVHARLTLSSSSLEPAQVFLLLTPTTGANPKTAVFVATAQNGAVYNFKLEVSSGEFIESLSGSGKYTVEVLLGDALAKSAVQWRVGALDITVPATAAAPSQADVFAPKPAIKHAFRAAEDRPSRLIALAFTVIVCLPFAALLLQLTAGNLLSFKLPGSAGEAFWMMIFHASLGAILAGYVLYWLFLNIFQALALTAVLALVAIFSGQKALKAHHTRLNKKAS